MSDLETKLRGVERHTPPELWNEIELRAHSPGFRALPAPARRWPAVALALTVAAAALALVLVALHPFGSTLGPVSGPPTGSIFVSYRAALTSKSSEIWAVNPDGSGAARYIADGGDVLDEGAVWSPDGSMVAFVRHPSGGPGAIWIMHANGTGLAQLTSGTDVQRSLAWSPDGTRIAFESQGDPGASSQAIDLVDVTTGKVTEILRGDYIHPSFSPDGAHLVVISGFYGNRSYGKPIGSALDVVNADGSGLHRITRQGGRYWAVAWSPDGAWIAAQWSEAGGSDLNNDIWLMRPNGSDRRRLTDHYGWDGSPVWSPDGSQIAFASDRCAGRAAVARWIRQGNGPFELCVFVMHTDGRNVREIFQHGTFQSSPTSWRPSG